MEFGIFDHLDRSDLPLAEFYAKRLAVIEAYERAGFYAYHVAEHHSTPLGMAASPNLFLAAVAQRTSRLRFGPLVYALPLYHPLRIVEEICMLDQMSRGRLELGFGRGSSPIELAYYGQSPEAAERVYTEALEIVLQGLTQKTLNFHSESFSYTNVPMEIEPFQRPHPPLWYGVHAVESAERAARRGFNTVSLDSAPEARTCVERYRSVWRQHKGDAPLPKLGLGRFVVVAETDSEALALARRAYLRWHQSFTHLFRLHGRSQAHPRPPDFDQLMDVGQGIAGSPDRVTDFLKRQLAETGCNYLVGQFAFGDLPVADTLHSVALFAREIMPSLRG